MMSASVNASVIYDDFGQFDPYTGGGTGIPNDSVAWSSFTFQNTAFTMALTATERNCTAAVSNDGNGRFYAHAGINHTKCDNSPTTAGANWNFGFYLSIDTPDQTFASFGQALNNTPFGIMFNYDTDPSAAENGGFFDIWQFALASGQEKEFQSSQNLHFDWLDDPNYVFTPAIDFDPNVNGVYGISMTAFTIGGPIDPTSNFPFSTIAQVAIDVEVSSVEVPEPNSWILVVIALIILTRCKIHS